MQWLLTASKLTIILSKQLTQSLLNSVKVRGLIGFICSVFEELIKTLHTAEETRDTIFSFSLQDCSEKKWIDKERMNAKFYRQGQTLCKGLKTEGTLLSVMEDTSMLFNKNICPVLYPDNIV